MSVLTKENLEAIKPENYGSYKSIIHSLKETAVHHQGKDLPDPPVPEPSPHDKGRMTVTVFQNADGFIECHSGGWINIRVVQLEEDEVPGDEDLPAYTRVRAYGMPKFSQKPNMTPEECLMVYLQEKLNRNKRVDTVITEFKERKEHDRARVA